MFSAITEHGLQLQELKINFRHLPINIRNDSTRSSLTSIVKRIRCLDVSTEQDKGIIYDDADPDRSLCSVFRSPDVDLRSLTISTYHEVADRTGIILRGCRKASRLEFSGIADICQVMMSDFMISSYDFILVYSRDFYSYNKIMIIPPCQ
jgi:hypothetical protein